MADEYRQLVLNTILTDERFVEATFRDVSREEDSPWLRVTVRPVAIKEDRFLQFSYFDGVQDTTKNERYEDASQRLHEVLADSPRSIQATTTFETIRVQFSKKGRAIIHRERAPQDVSIPVDLAHDRRKYYLLPEDQPIPFLQTIGVMTKDGRVRADQRRKFRQINEFLRLIDETGAIEQLEDDPLLVVDMGCGSAALTFAVYYYLNEIKGRPSKMVGVDTKQHLMDRLSGTAQELEWPGLSFQTARILDYESPEPTPNIVLALHACDTATDEALARAVRWQSQLIFSAPCCHHHLQAQMGGKVPPVPFEPVMRHGIMRERLGDILTDSFRTHILRMLGYQTDILEFVPIEHTPKNLMIRAVRSVTKLQTSLVDEYIRMKSYWGVTPYLETLLKDELNPILPT
ncbi:MAG: SAM-dependent methyltransferase [Chloroflexota bacterium]|jgi:SAM-dependent methyltransferase